MVEPRTARAIPRENLRQFVSDDLEGRILSGEIAIGERLPSESEIAKEYGVSTRSVREAIQILETKGLLQRRHGERTRVVRNDVGEFLGTLTTTVRQLFAKDRDYLVQLMDVRRMIEVEVAGILAGNSAPVALDVSRSLEAMHDAARNEDFTSFTTHDAAFHLALVKSTGNDILAVLYDNLHNLITEVIRVTSRVPVKSLEEAYAEHKEIFTAIHAGDPDHARSVMRRHIENSSGYLHVAILNARNEENPDGS
ncbi:FadR/GntR family transcriptional regulator [Qingshengfaniella alkalisoli]|uniref:FadR family transcriptional regulator n=1 Tax=Qingshengfaniella alkalisoli TaxID=2599296 RepID=A0A5B8J0D2_9RHOB|nr:FadR/GntR family transcriptional regulator [Qingshengfaniella alkalisoli]QDY70641.1 FadR family transcriptional regulator [Qingshengfaniella alkalisoli]